MPKIYIINKKGIVNLNYCCSSCPINCQNQNQKKELPITSEKSFSDLYKTKDDEPSEQKLYCILYNGNHILQMID